MKSPKLLVLSALVAGLAAPVGAYGQSDGLYISGGLGSAIPRDSDIDGTGINLRAEFDPGIAAAVAVGTTFGGNLRGR